MTYIILMTHYIHPAKDDLTLPAILAALADPVRLGILKNMMKENGCISCCKAVPEMDMAKSTISHHFRILRESGLIRTVKKGVESRNTLRLDDVNERFPGLLKAVLKFAD